MANGTVIHYTTFNLSEYLDSEEEPTTTENIIPSSDSTSSSSGNAPNIDSSSSSLDLTEETITSNSSEGKSKGFIFVMIFIGIFLVLLVGFLIFILPGILKKSKEKNNSPEVVGVISNSPRPPRVPLGVKKGISSKPFPWRSSRFPPK